MPERSDEELLIAAGGGDRSAFGALVERHHRAIVRFAYRFLGNVDRDTAEDLAQDVFLNAWKAASSFQPRAKVSTWLLRIATKACLNYRRSRRLRRAASLSSQEIADPLASSGRADGPATTGEEAAQVRNALAALPSNQRAAIVLRHFHDLPYAEIAEVLGTSVSAVESMLFRARRTLRGKLADLQRPADSPQVLSELGAESL